MGLLFRKRFRLSKWLSLNLSKSGVGLSVGPPGAKFSVNQKRARVQLGIPGTGIGYRKDVSLPREPDAPPLPEPSTSRHRVGFWLLAAVGLILLILWLSACGFPAWRDQALRDVAEGRWHVDPAQVPASGTSSQTIEFRDASGRNVGYGRVQGGTVEFFNPDSSRAGFGKVGR
ncbi:MAG: DUF4236 domain-containing protein [Candidatus Methylomirabilis oxyfera]|nr:DUF4236 domain-containing protein [Candidatus Methylomirabilis oxyfera]